MNITETRRCIEMSLSGLAKYLNVAPDIFLQFYREIQQDATFLEAINNKITFARNYLAYTNGLFRMAHLDTVDWFALNRILIYVLVRYFRPALCLETGVLYGGNTAFILAALHRNGAGRLISIDYPDSQIRQNQSKQSNQPDDLLPSFARHPLVGVTELYDAALKPGFIVPDYLLDRLTLILGDSLTEMQKMTDSFDFYLHDSEHSMSFVLQEVTLAWKLLSSHGIAVVDDIDWSNAFATFCAQQRLYPFYLCDCGKDELRVRTGLLVKNHANNYAAAFTY